MTRHRLDITVASDDEATIEQLRKALTDQAFMLEPITITVTAPYDALHRPGGDPQAFTVDVEQALR